jgi:hypothetical protein
MGICRAEYFLLIGILQLVHYSFRRYGYLLGQCQRLSKVEYTSPLLLTRPTRQNGAQARDADSLWPCLAIVSKIYIYMVHIGHNDKVIAK